VFVPTGFDTLSWRRPIVLIAIWLVVLQTFLAGVATAQAGATAAFDPLGAICHGSDGGGPAGAAAPDADKVRHLCCEYCTSAAPALAPPDAMGVAVPQSRAAAQRRAISRFIIVISRGAVRVGPSQAPPASA
jgi:Protein of unknown function (DUF2946)